MLKDGPMRLGVSLGSFRDAELERSQLASLEKRGVQNARLSQTAVSATRFQLRDLDAAASKQLAAIAKEFPAHGLHACTGG